MTIRDDAHDVRKPGPERSHGIASVIGQVRASRAGGERLDDEAIISAHPELMPELGLELQKLARIEAAWAAAERSAAGVAESGESVVPSGVGEELACAVAADLERPAIEVPGYTVLREIGHGGQAVVFLAIKLNPGRRVALKVMRDGSVAGERALARFHREAAVLAKLNHPNIVNVFETGRTADGRHYFTMNYIAGCGLGEYMLARRDSDLDDPGKLLRLFFRICEVVNTAHKAKVVHRDLKPANIRIDERGEPHILDFGLARSTFDRAAAGLSTSEATDETISVTGEFLGSLPWSSPEQVAGDPGRIDVRTDVYSLGVILYQMLTGGRFPYEVVGNIRDVLNNIVTSEPTPPSKVIAAALAKESARRDPARTHLPAVNDEIEKIVLKALAKHPEDRYPDAGQLGAAIADYLLGRKAADGGEAEPRPPFRKKARWPIAVAAGIGALLTIACIVWQTSRAPPGPTPVRLAGPGNVAMAGVSGPPIVTESNIQSTAPTTSASTNDGRVVDLLQLIDVDQDVLFGPEHWGKSAAGLAYDGMFSDGRADSSVRVGYEPPAEYDYRLTFTTSSKEGNLHLLLPYGQRPCEVCFDGGIKPNCRVMSWDDGEALITNQAVEPGVPHRAVVQVRDGRISVYLDDKLVARCRTDVGYLGAPRFRPYVGERTVGVWVERQSIIFSSMEVVELKGAGVRIRRTTIGMPPCLSKPPPRDNPRRLVDLMPLIQPRSDAVRGTWSRVGDQLFVEQCTKFSRLAVPYHPPEEYDFHVEFTRTVYNNEVALMLSKQHTSFAYLMGFNANTACGFAMVYGKAPNTSPTGVTAPGILLNKRRYSAVVYVRKDYIAAAIDGKLISEYQTDGSDLQGQADWAIGDGLLGVGSWFAPVTFHKIEIAEITGEGKPVRN